MLKALWRLFWGTSGKTSEIKIRYVAGVGFNCLPLSHGDLAVLSGKTLWIETGDGLQPLGRLGGGGTRFDFRARELCLSFRGGSLVGWEDREGKAAELLGG
jgi:hypothetical protein